MSSQKYDSDTGKPMKSMRDDRIALATFISGSERKIDVFWLDYNGERVRYSTMDPHDTFPILTYETHPWIFRDSESGSVLLADGHEVYYPEAYDGGEQPVVIIHIPVYTLRDICLMEVRRSQTREEIKHLDIPRHIIPELLHEDRTPYRIHLHF